MKGGHAGAILDVDPFTQKDVKQNGFVVLRPAGRGIVVDICINLTRARREAEPENTPSTCACVVCCTGSSVRGEPPMRKDAALDTGLALTKLVRTRGDLACETRRSVHWHCERN